MKSGVLHYGSDVIPYQVLDRPKRKTLGIEVHPDGLVYVLAPASCGDRVIRERLERRAGWINRQRATFARYRTRTAPRQYLSGETHRYLGRQYRLKLVINPSAPRSADVKLTRGALVVASRTNLRKSQVRDLLNRWYRERSREIFHRVLADAVVRFSRKVSKHPSLAIRAMQRRWGSMSQRGRMTLNLRLIEAPKACIEYVVVHELCHLIHRAHNAKFYLTLTRFMPDWKARKERLEMTTI